MHDKITAYLKMVVHITLNPWKLWKLSKFDRPGECSSEKNCYLSLLKHWPVLNVRTVYPYWIRPRP